MAMLQLDRLRSLGLRSFGLRPFGLGTGATIAAAALLAVAVTGAAFAQAERYELDALDRWKKVADVAPGSEEAQLLAARRALVDGEPARAQKLANAFLERYPLSRYRADALLVRGDSKRGSD